MMRRMSVHAARASLRPHSLPPVFRAAGLSFRGLATGDTDSNIELRRDIKHLGWALGDAMKKDEDNGEQTYATVEELRSLAKAWRKVNPSGFGAPANDEALEKLEKMVSLAKELPTPLIRESARAFQHFLALANTAESHHRVRRVTERNVESGSLSEMVAKREYGTYPRQPLGSTVGVVQRLLGTYPHEAGELPATATPEQIFEALCTQSVEIVLTAHPTEVTRRTVVQRHREIEKSLTQLDHPALRWDYVDDHRKNLLRQVKTLWWTDEIRREKPTPWKEARHGLEIVATSMWHAVPCYLRRIDSEMLATPGIKKPLPPDVAPVTFSSWMGGDRDGNPNVTPEVTKAVVLMSRLRGASLVREALVQLRQEICVSKQKATPELLALLEDKPDKPAGKASSKGIEHFRGRAIDQEAADNQPYSQLFELLADRLDASIEMLEQGQLKPDAPVEGELEPLVDSKELIEILMTAHRSLCEVGLCAVADGSLRDLIRQLKCFGLSLLPLDCRNESVRHSEALDAITRYLGIGSYLSWDESTRQSWLLKELSEKRPLLPKCNDLSALGNMFNETVCDTLGTFDAIAEVPEESLGAYVISMAQSASDVLAVRLLQSEAGVANPMRVVPLFETLDDLSNAPDIMEELWGMTWYKGDIDRNQEVMLGYSDSAKDAGRLAAAWAQYQTQESLVAAADKHGINLSLFHGKGGTVSRGGDPSTFRAICAQPPGTVNGRFRITEQGEIITQNYAHRAVAERHLNTYTAALLYENFIPKELREPKPEHRELLDGLSDVSCAAYRKVVNEEPSFIPYFRSATPEIEIASLNVGSRPAKRRPTGGVETLRAIPWVFAWTQTRLNLTAWLGIGPALNGLDDEQRATLKDMYETLPWFTAVVDVVDRVLAMSEPDIAANYDKQLVKELSDIFAGSEHVTTKEEMLELGEHLRDQLETTRQELLALRGYTQCQEENDILQRGLKVRNPYVDPLNVLQAEVLNRLREEQYADEAEMTLLQDALVITITGIANGQKNSG